MGPTLTLPDELFERAQKLAVPLVDTLETVIARAFDALEAANARRPGAGTPPAAGGGDADIRAYNPASPPNLTFTKPLSIILRGNRLPHGQLYWNALMLAAIHEAAALGLQTDALMKLMVVPSTVGRKEDHGYKFLKDLGISVQGQDANNAWKQAYHIAMELGFPVEVVWRWQIADKASLPGRKGSFSVG